MQPANDPEAASIQEHRKQQGRKRSVPCWGLQPCSLILGSPERSSDTSRKVEKPFTLALCSYENTQFRQTKIPLILSDRLGFLLQGLANHVDTTPRVCPCSCCPCPGGWMGGVIIIRMFSNISIPDQKSLIV